MGSGGQTGHTYDISNKHRLGYSEVQLVQTMIDGVNTLWKEDLELQKNTVCKFVKNRNYISDLFTILMKTHLPQIKTTSRITLRTLIPNIRRKKQIFTAVPQCHIPFWSDISRQKVS